MFSHQKSGLEKVFFLTISKDLKSESTVSEALFHEQSRFEENKNVTSEDTKQ